MGESMRIDQIATDYETERLDREVEELAAERGCEVVFSDERTLQMDIDNEGDYDLCLSQILRMTDEGLLEHGSREEWRSRSGNRHVQVKLVEPAPEETRILLQALLGSDRVRELLNLRRHRAGLTGKICLFRPLVPVASTAAKEPFLDDDLPF